MNKKLLAVLALSATLIVGCSNVAKTDRIQEGAVDGLGNITESRSVRNGVIGSDNVFAHSKTYVQYGKTDAGQYAMRFATAVKGDIDSLSYTRAAIAGKEAATFQVTTVYRGIEAGEAVYYYDGTDLTTDASHAGNYYWACYTIAFETKEHFATNIEVTFNANDAVVSEKASALTDVCDDCEVVGHTWVREGTVKSTSTTHGETVKLCGTCGYEHREELPFNESVSSSIHSSGEDKELNYVDIARGIHGDAQVKITFRNQTPAGNKNWAVGRTVLLTSDTASYAGTNDEIYGKGLPNPEKPGSYNGASKMFFNAWDGDYGNWFPGAYTDHTADMDVDVTVTRVGELATIHVVGKCNLHNNEYNENNSSFYIPKDKGLNVILATTFAELTIKSTSLDLTFNSKEETLSAPIVQAPSEGANTEHEVHTHHFARDNYQKITIKYNEKDSKSKGDNQWGHWRGYFWRADMKDAQGNMLKPFPDSSNSGNGTVLTRLTPPQDHYTNWNGMQRIIHLEGGVTGEHMSAGDFSWFKSTDPNFVDNFGELMNDVDVTLTIVKLHRFYLFTFEYSSNVYENTTAHRYFGGGCPSLDAAFTLAQEKSTITLSSVTVEKF